MADAVAALAARLGPTRWTTRWPQFVEQFPPLAVVRDGQDPAAYLAARPRAMPNREIALEELLMLWLANVNPAFATFDELFDDAELVEKTAYGDMIVGLREFFDSQPGFGPGGDVADRFPPGSGDGLAGLAGRPAAVHRTRWGLV